MTDTKNVESTQQQTGQYKTDDKVIINGKEFVVNKHKYCSLNKDLYDGCFSVGPSFSKLEQDQATRLWFEPRGKRAYLEYLPLPVIVKVGDKVIIKYKEYIVNNHKYCPSDKNLYNGDISIGGSVSPLEKDPVGCLWFEPRGSRAYQQY